MLKLRYNKIVAEAGCDEAGRGCLAGPVFAAAVILPEGLRIEGLDDSKKLTSGKREKLRRVIEDEAVSFGIGLVNPDEIDEINILNASFLAMHRALDKLIPVPQFIIIDGNRFKAYRDIPFECIVKGDAKFQSIAAASILAKTYRDKFMKELTHEFPEYGWERNKGYPTFSHRIAIRKFGITKYHRKSFKLIDSQLMIEF